MLCQGFFGRFFDIAAKGFGPFALPGVRYFNGVKELLETNGHRVLCPPTHPLAGIERRALQIARFLDEHVADKERCLLIGHSMGGLDCRHLLTHLGRHGVDALLTVATPHRGTSFADYCMTHLQDQAGIYTRLQQFGLDVDAGQALTRDAARRFNLATRDVPEVRYFSVTTAAPVAAMNPLFRFSGGIIEREEGANDGLVSKHSSRWGEVLDHWPVDHAGTLNKRVLPGGPNIAPRWLAAVETMETRLAVAT